MADRPSLSRTITTELRNKILAGELSPGAVMPSERELIATYGTTKSTVSKAISVLRAEGLVTTEFGRGTFVRSRSPLRRISAARRHAVHRASGEPIFDTQAKEHGQVPSRRMLSVGRETVPPEAALWLQISPGDEAAVRKRLQLLDDKPAVVSTSYYPLWIAGGTRLEEEGPLPEGPDELIESLGHAFSHGTEVFRARMPTPEEGELLHLEPGIPVVQMWDVDYNAEGRALQAAYDVYAGDRHEFGYQWAEEDIKR